MRLALVIALLAAAPDTTPRVRGRDLGEGTRVRELLGQSSVPVCDFTGACNASNNLLTSPGDLANAAWSTYAPGSSISIGAATTATVDGQTLPYNRVQFGAVEAGEESTFAQRIGGASDLCQNKVCTYSIYLRSHPGASVTTGNLPIGTASDGNDGTGYQLCPFTASWSRCELTMTSPEAAGFSFFYVGYVASQSGTSAALDLDLGGPKAEYGGGGATAYQCPSPLQVSGVPSHTGYVNSQTTADWGILDRDGAGLVTVADGTMVLLGGWSTTTEATWGNNRTTNEIYKSNDLGATWTVVQAHADDPDQTGAAARWRRRHSHCSLVTTIGGTEYIYVIGGDFLDTLYGDANGPFPADVWRAPAATYGAANTWTRMTATAEWGATGASSDGGLLGRILHMCWADDSGNLYVAGGQTSLLVGTARNDVWKSTNGGATWTSLGNAPWTARGTVANALPRLNGKTWLYGGMQYDNTQGNRVHFRDVWSFDDSNWTLVNADGGFPARGYHNALSWGGRLWMLRGHNGANLPDAYSSADGFCWRPERDAEGWTTHAASATADGGSLVLTGGATSTAVSKISAP